MYLCTVRLVCRTTLCQKKKVRTVHRESLNAEEGYILESFHEVVVSFGKHEHLLNLGLDNLPSLS